MQQPANSSMLNAEKSLSLSMTKTGYLGLLKITENFIFFMSIYVGYNARLSGRCAAATEHLPEYSQRSGLHHFYLKTFFIHFNFIIKPFA